MATQNANLPKVIKATRIKHKMTQEEFGNIFNPPAAKSIVSRWEKGNSIPSPERLSKISELSGYSVEELLYGSLESAISDLIMKSLDEVNTFFRDSKKLDKTISSSNFIDSFPDPKETEFLQDMFDFVCFKKESYFGTPRPKAFKKNFDTRTQADKKEIEAFYRQEYIAGCDYLHSRAYNICKRTGIKPYETGKIMHVLAKEAKLVFSEINRDNAGLISFVSYELEDLYASKIPDFIYGTDSNGNKIKLTASIDENLENEIETIIANTVDKIYNLIPHEE